jgi:2-polyprenyl-6-methoxyphenol hydroxylase-like FAD-dependent oxidoreductase
LDALGGSSVDDVEHVLIVGGGIGGLTIAAALHQQGLWVDVVERNPEWHTLGAGLSVQPNGLRVLRQLGLDSAVIDAGCVVGRWLFADQHGEVLCDIDLEGVWGEVGPCVGIARSRLQEVLVAGARPVPCRLGTSIAAIDERDRQVSVRFTDGSTGDYDLVVGADGIRSTVRDLAFGQLEPTFAGQISWRSIAPIALPGPPSIQFWLGDGCFFGLCSVGDCHTYGFGYIAHERQYDPVEGRLVRLRNRFADFGDTVQAYLARLERDEQIHCSTIEWIEQDRWHTGRVVLIGDAAHASSPMMGQGGSLAMEDAWVLAELLRTEPTLKRALVGYAKRRVPRVTWVQQQSRTVADSFNLPPQVRNEVLRSRGEAMFNDRYAPLTPEP